jgi:3-oxoacyl-ACP reductase-like protein
MTEPWMRERKRESTPSVMVAPAQSAAAVRVHDMPSAAPAAPTASVPPDLRRNALRPIINVSLSLFANFAKKSMKILLFLLPSVKNETLRVPSFDCCGHSAFVQWCERNRDC